MEFTKKEGFVYYPSGSARKVERLCIAAHHDDIELMAYHGVSECFGKDGSFAGVVVTDGAGSPRSGLYADYTDEMMKRVRVLEQKKAAFVGEYGAQYFLSFSSKEVKTNAPGVVENIAAVIRETKPRVIYTHNFADKHDTHCAVALRVIEAIRTLDKSERPELLLGCEVWRDLDWVRDEKKVVLDVSGHPNLSRALTSVFDSQICGGKRYDLAADGRRLANATYFASHATDEAEMLNYAIDMTPMILDDSLTPERFICSYIDDFKAEVTDRLARLK